MREKEIIVVGISAGATSKSRSELLLNSLLDEFSQVNCKIKKIAILQSNYIPWKGYFDLINLVDEFVLYDDAQYTKNDWRNRNKIKTNKGLQWLTIPVTTSGKPHQKIKDANDGCLSILTSGVEIPFDIKRVYFINGLKEQQSVRGKHAHKNLDQVLFCLSGHFVLSLDDGRKKQSLMFSARPEGVWIGRVVWHTMESFSHDCVILVLASAPYDERDYIRDYDEFKRVTTGSAFL